VGERLLPRGVRDRARLSLAEHGRGGGSKTLIYHSRVGA